MSLRETMETERRLNSAFQSIIIVMIICAIIYLIRCCDAEPADAQDNTALVLAQCIRAECDTCTKDKREPSAILHVLRKAMVRWNANHLEQRTIADQARAYCALFDRSSQHHYGQRASNIRASTFSRPIHGTAEWWAQTRETVELFLSGGLADPTPAADHFGGAMDTHRAVANGWRLVATMSNRFWCSHGGIND